MRFLVIAITAVLLLPPAIAPAQACGAGLHSTKAAAVDYSAKKKAKKTAKKVAKKKKEKVEYMRIVPAK